MNYKTKSAFIVFELLLVIFISSFILINSFTSIKDIFLFTKYQQMTAISKIDLLSSKIFLQKNVNNLNKLKLEKETLYFNNSILLEKVENFSISKNNQYIKIEFKITNKNIIWILEL